MSDRVRAELQREAERLFDAWFDPLWEQRHLEIEVYPDRRWTLDRVEEGLRLRAPFGLDTDQDSWFQPVRDRPLLRRAWRPRQSVSEAGAALERTIAEALRRA